jgi:hypothetical protein
VSPSSRTPLASGTINGNTLPRIELIEPNRGKPPLIANRMATNPHCLRTGPARRHRCRSNENLGEQRCQPCRHPSTTEAVAAQDKSPGEFSPGLCHPLRAGVLAALSGYRSPLRNRVPRSNPTRDQRSNASKSNGLPS